LVLQKAKLNNAAKIPSGIAPLILVIPALFRSVPTLKAAKYLLRVLSYSEL